jgi:hypothetical protein
MYAVELRFAVECGRLAPSSEVLQASVRRHGGHGEVRIEHISVKRIVDDIQVVAFVLVDSVADAENLAGTLGHTVPGEFLQLRFSGFRIWRDETFGESE